MAVAGASVREVLEQYKIPITELRTKVTQFLEDQNDEALRLAAEEFPMDDFCLLKFLLSAQRKKDKSIEVACDNLIKTLHFRKEKRDMLQEAKRIPELQFYIPSVSPGILLDEMVTITFFGKADMGELAKKYETAEAATRRGLFVSEQFRLLIDNHSRETGRLCKMFSIVDLEGLSLFRSTSRLMMTAMGAVSKSNEINTPQLLGRIVCINVPSIFHVILKMFTPFMSKSSLEKISLCGGKKGRHDISQCPFMAKYSTQETARIREALGATFNH